jgi:hypothetical protein
MRIRIPTPAPHPTGGPPSGCVPHLPAPECWPERKTEDIDSCFPSKGLLESLADLAKKHPRGKRRMR